MERPIYIWMFIVIIGTSFLLLKATDNYEPIEFAKQQTIQHIDTLKVVEIRVAEYEGKKESLKDVFKITDQHQSYFKKDTIEMEFRSGSWGFGYYVMIQIIGNTFTSKIKVRSCMPFPGDKLIISKQTLKLEEFHLTDNTTLKGAFYCEARHRNKNLRNRKIIIKGGFETRLRKFQ